MDSAVDSYPRSEKIFLNSGTLSRTPIAAVEALRRHVADHSGNPNIQLFGAWERLWDVQRRLAKFFNADPKDMFLRPNVTYVMNDFILGVELPPGGEIAVTDLEYGAIVNVCKLRSRRENRPFRVIELRLGADAYRSPEEIVEHVVAQLTEKTCLLMISHVMTGTGLTVPLELLGAEMRKRNIALAVDGAHGVGALPLDFSRLGDVDFYGGNLHKWFTGPTGTAFGWVEKSVQSKVHPIMGTWTTETPTPPHIQVFGEGSEFAQRMMMSHTNQFAPFYALHECLDLHERLGPEKIRERLTELWEFTHQTVTDTLGWTLVSPKDRRLRGPLLTYAMPAPLVERGFQVTFDLWNDYDLQVITPLIKGVPYLRLSPHIYTTEKEITEGIVRIREYCDKLGVKR